MRFYVEPALTIYLNKPLKFLEITLRSPTHNHCFSLFG